MSRRKNSGPLENEPKSEAQCHVSTVEKGGALLQRRKLLEGCELHAGGAGGGDDRPGRPQAAGFVHEFVAAEKLAAGPGLIHHNRKGGSLG